MPTQVQFRRGTTSQNNSFTGAAGELSVDTQLNVIRVHDGTTAGGHALITGSSTVTLTNKTINLTSNTLSGTIAQFNTALSDGDFATLAGTETLTNKTLTSPTMTTPTLGVASATSINKVAITAPATGSTLTIAEGKTLTASNTLTLTGTDSSSVAFGAGGTVAYTANKLSAFAATTSSELAGVISDETGSGSLVFSADPTFTGTVNAANLTLSGDLIVNGTTTTVNSNTVSIGDNIIVLNSDEAGTPSQNAGIEVERGTSTNATLLWNESTDSWVAGVAGSEVDLVTTSGTQTLTNKTINGSQLVAGSVANAALTNSTISGKALGTNLDTLTMAVSGTGLSGSQTYNGAAAATFTVTSNATNANTASTLVARDASGNFSAGTITAALSGNASTVTNGVYTTDTGTVTSTMIADGTIVNADINASAAIAVSKLAANTISGVTLGNNLNTLTIGTGLSGTSYNGSAAVTIANTSVTSNVAGTGVSVSGATGAVTISIGQAVATSSNVQFNSIGVNTAASGTSGEIRATNEITAYYSDARLKNFHGTIDNALHKVMALSGYYFTENEVAKSLGYTNDKQQVGVSAQEVEAVLPEAVAPAPIDEQYLTVKYEKLVPLLIEAIKEQQKKIEELEAKINKQ